MHSVQVHGLLSAMANRTRIIHACCSKQVRLCRPSQPAWVQVDDKDWIRGVVAGENQVQLEDVSLCDLVQEGIQSPAYDVGRSASHVMHDCFSQGIPALSCQMFLLRFDHAEQGRDSMRRCPDGCTLSFLPA